MIKKVNISDGSLKYWQRIELGQILTSEELTDTEKMLKSMECMLERKPEIEEYMECIEYYKEIIEGIRLWIERENIELRNTPTPEEIQAGIEKLSKEIGDFGTANELAKNYGKTPEEVLNWEYHYVFAILRDDVKKNQYRSRLNSIIEQKRTKKYKN